MDTGSERQNPAGTPLMLGLIILTPHLQVGSRTWLQKNSRVAVLVPRLRRASGVWGRSRHCRRLRSSAWALRGTRQYLVPFMQHGCQWRSFHAQRGRRKRSALRRCTQGHCARASAGALSVRCPREEHSRPSSDRNLRPCYALAPPLSWDLISGSDNNLLMRCSCCCDWNCAE